VPQNEVFVLVLWYTEQQFLKSCEEPDFSDFWGQIQV
jgi:hypothetical protein